MAKVLASPPRLRCNVAACCGGVIAPFATLTHSCTSRTNSRNGTLPAGSQWGPLLRASFIPRCMCPTARPRHIRITPRGTTLT
eukprot:4629036-Pyramimonas_sp.AAC.1